MHTTCYNSLTEQDLETMRRYMKHNARVNVVDLKPVLSRWEANKRTLFKGLGKQLRVTLPITISRNHNMFYNQIKDLYGALGKSHFVNFETDSSFNYIKDYTRNEFIFSFFSHYVKETLKNTYRHEAREEFGNLAYIFNYYTIECNEISKNIELPSCGLKFQKGTRPMRAIQKIIKKTNYPHTELFEQWRNAISNLCSNRSFKGNLTLSIHPLDFMTLSDNKCDWSSCMNWRNGSYSLGTVEMMNSNCAMVAYLNSDTEFAPHGLPIPNKSWRALVFAHKDILIVGKNYPYRNEDLELLVLKEVSALLKKNLNWDYQYKDQLYKDLFPFQSNSFVRESLSRQKMRYKENGASRHKIICYTDFMYNDMIEDKDFGYYCYRNKPKKTLFLNLSGPVTCLCCGETRYEWLDDLSVYSNSVCRSCRANLRCRLCGHTLQDHEEVVFIEKGTHIICEDCSTEYFYFPALDSFLPKDKYYSTHRSTVFYSYDLHRSKRISHDILRIMLSKYCNPLRKNSRYTDLIAHLDLYSHILLSGDTDDMELTITEEYFDLLLEIVRKEELNETSTTV